MDKLDYKKEYKDLYLPPRTPVVIDAPPVWLIQVDGAGPPEGDDYQAAMRILYSLSFTIKMSKLSGKQPEGYFEYVVPPLEGLWWGPEGRFDPGARERWLWVSMIRQPEFVTPAVFESAAAECRRKKPEVDVSRARFARFEEGLCVQMLHVGPYANEAASLAQMREFLTENGLRDESGPSRRHHEIYLSDPRRTAPERLKTVLRLPVRRA